MEPRMLHRSLKEQPHTVVSAKGPYLTLSDGTRIFDACGGAAVAIIGHGNEEVIAAATAQMHKVSYVHTAAYTTESAEELATCILEPVSHGNTDDESQLLQKAFFVGSGSEANDAAMKCARQYWFEKGEIQRKFFIVRKQSYHGNTIGAMSLSSVRGRKTPYEDILLTNVSFVSPADFFHRPLGFDTEQEYAGELAREMEAEILRLGPENVISVIGETVSGATLGAMPAPRGYWPLVRALCNKYGILLHLDEVMCGMGRTGTYYAFEQENVLPDIVTIGKGLGGGYAPIAGMLINGKIVNALKQGTSSFNHGQTYQAHPLTCATALAVQRIVLRDGLVSRCAEQGTKLEKLLQNALSGAKHVADIRGRGLFWAVEFLQDVTQKIPFPPTISFGSKVQLAAFDMGMAFYPGAATIDGINGDHVTLAPPYTVTDEELADIATVLRRAYDHVVATLNHH